MGSSEFPSKDHKSELPTICSPVQECLWINVQHKTSQMTWGEEREREREIGLSEMTLSLSKFSSRRDDDSTQEFSASSS